jgi:hypothetical protein
MERCNMNTEISFTQDYSAYSIDWVKCPEGGVIRGFTFGGSSHDHPQMHLHRMKAFTCKFEDRFYLVIARTATWRNLREREVTRELMHTRFSNMINDCTAWKTICTYPFVAKTLSRYIIGMISLEGTNLAARLGAGETVEWSNYNAMLLLNDLEDLGRYNSLMAMFKQSHTLAHYDKRPVEDNDLIALIANLSLYSRSLKCKLVDAKWQDSSKQALWCNTLDVDVRNAMKDLRGNK